MGEFIFSIGKPKVNKSTLQNQLWQITNIGTQKVDSYTGSENPKFKTLSSVASIGPANVEDIATDSHLGKDVVSFQLRQLKAEHCVSIMGTKGKE